MRTLPISGLRFNNSFKSAEIEQDERTTAVVSEPQSEKKTNKTALVTAAVAVAALGVSAFALAKGRKIPESKNEATYESLKNELTAEMEKLLQEVKTKEPDVDVSATLNGITEKFNQLKEKINNLGQNNNVNDIYKELSSLRDVVNGVVSKNTVNRGFVSELVNVNGKELVLGQVLNPLKKDALTAMEKTLRTESTRRMLGVGQGLDRLPEEAIIRIPTSEFKGFASTGGMSEVPKEVADNIARLIAGKQDAMVIVDIPLYRGTVEKSETKKQITRRYNDLIAQQDGTYRYIQTAIETENGKVKSQNTKNLGILKKVGSMDVRVLTENGAKIEKVDTYMHESSLNLDYNTVKEHFSEEAKNLAASLANGETRELGTLVLSKDNEGNIKAAAKVRTMLYDNGKGGKFDLNVSADRANNIYNNEAISTGETERFTYFSKFFYENIARTEEGRVLNLYEADVSLNKINKIKAQIEQLKKDGKLTSTEEASKIEEIKKIELERQKSINASKQYLGADLIIGNDWQTGPISAMIRQLTTARKNYGMNPIVADKLQNTPVVTILHNAGLSGGCWHSQDKLLNIMFGEHSATIVKNAHMPNIAIAGKKDGIDSRLFNGFMEGDGVNPQMMAVAYSDFIVPVSDGYAKEIATNEFFGGARTRLFEFRAREGVYNNVDNLKLIANQNGVEPELVTTANPTMIGITNGSDKANNVLKAIEGEKGTSVQKLAKQLNLPEDTFTAYVPGTDKLEWHNKNKMAAIRKWQEDINAAKGIGVDVPDNRMKIEMPLDTDLSGVTEKTPVFVSAGRIVDQKGLDIFAQGIKEFYKDFKGGDYPVFYIQGIGDPKYKEMILNVKKEIQTTNPAAAKRIVFANLFSEPGRYDLAKLATDWSVMSSWFEPCGLVHKQIGQFSGAGSVVNRTGGLPSELQEGVNVVVSEFNPDKKQLEQNGKNFAKAIAEAVKIHQDENKYRQVVESMVTSNFDWAREGGAIHKYLDIFKRLNVVSENVK